MHATNPRFIMSQGPAAPPLLQLLPAYLVQPTSDEENELARAEPGATGCTVTARTAPVDTGEIPAAKHPRESASIMGTSPTMLSVSATSPLRVADSSPSPLLVRVPASSPLVAAAAARSGPGLAGTVPSPLGRSVASETSPEETAAAASSPGVTAAAASSPGVTAAPASPPGETVAPPVSPLVATGAVSSPLEVAAAATPPGVKVAPAVSPFVATGTAPSPLEVAAPASPPGVKAAPAVATGPAQSPLDVAAPASRPGLKAAPAVSPLVATGTAPSPLEVAAASPGAGVSTLPGASDDSAATGDRYDVPIRDARVRAFLEAIPTETERREQLGRAAELGVLALQAARPLDAAVDLQRRFIELTEKVQHDATGAFDGEIARLRCDLNGVVERVESQIRLLDQKANHIVDQEKRLDELIDATRHNSALMGANFEARLVNNLDRFAAPRVGDSVTYTGNTNEVDKKVGDIVYRLAINGNPDDTVGVAIEAKNTPCARSGPKAFFLNELDAGMANRNCPYGIVVTTMEKNSEHEQPTFPFIQALPGKRFVVLVDELVHYPIALEATLQAIHKEILTARTATTPDVDVKRINEAVVRAVEVAEMFRALKSNLSAQVKELTRMRENVDKMQTQFEDSMAEVRQEIDRATGRSQN